MTISEVHRSIGEAALSGLMDRKVISEILKSIKECEEEIWNEVLEEAGRLALLRSSNILMGGTKNLHRMDSPNVASSKPRARHYAGGAYVTDVE